MSNIIYGIDYGNLIFSKRRELDQQAYSNYYNTVRGELLLFNEWYGTPHHIKYIQTHLRKIKLKKIMKAKILIEKEIKFVKVEVAVRYDDEDIPYDFPLRKGDVWSAKIDIDKGQIIGWPKGKSGQLAMKVCDQGTYTLFDENEEEVLKIEEDYVPNSLLPGKYGDYIDLKINEDGIITNWYKNPSIEDFLEN